MIDNTELLDQLLASERLRLVPDPLLGRAPAPLPARFDFGRVEGMLLGLAIGDSLGNTSESQHPAARRASLGEIRDYLPNHRTHGERMGLPSDDTQLAFWTLEQLLADEGLVPEHLAQRFSGRQIFGIGSTVREFLNRRFLSCHWTAAGPESAGNGALMRIAPVLVPHLRVPSASLWADAALAGMVTHNDRASNSGCVAFVHLLWECLGLDASPAPEWWVDTFCDVMEPLEGQTSYRPRIPGTAYAGPMGRYVRSVVHRALDASLPTKEACDSWYSGAFLMETLPSVLYILARYGHDPEEAIVRAVNDTVDNDTVAAIVGAAVGGLHGMAALPPRWRAGLLGRTSAWDDGRVFELIAEARATFWSR